MSMPRIRRLLPARNLITMVAGPILWFGYFMAAYGLNAVRCAFSIETALFGINIIQYATSGLALLTLAVLLLFAGVALRRRSEAKQRLSAGSGADEAQRDLFLAGTGLTLTFLSLVSTVWVWLPTWVVPPCA